MQQIELLWKLQCADKEIHNLKKGLKDKRLYNQLQEIKNKYELIKNELSSDTELLEACRKKTLRLNNDLKFLDEKRREDTQKLYSGMSNLKMINSIQKEIEEHGSKIDKIENGLLEAMEQETDLRKKITQNKNELSILKGQFDVLKKDYNEKTEALKADIKVLEDKRQHILDEMDVKLSKQYSDMAARMNNPVSRVDNGICGECSVKLNAMLCDALKRKDEIHFCEHCGRILYTA